MNPKEIQALIDQVRYKDGWCFDVINDFSSGERGHLYLQVKFKARCHATGRVQLQSGRKWLLSRHATKTEIIRTAFLACLQAEIHEAHEAFEYQPESGKPFRPVFNLHTDIDRMWHECAHVDVRPPMLGSGPAVENCPVRLANATRPRKEKAPFATHQNP